MYFPKALSRFSPKVEEPLTLRNLCLGASVKLLAIGLSKCDKDARKKKHRKIIRAYFNQTIPREIQEDLIKTTLEKWFGTDKTLNLLDACQPPLKTRQMVDLLGSFRYAYGCYFAEHRLYWSNGTIERLNMTKEQCDRLHSILLLGNLNELKSLAISTQRHAFHASRLPNALARSCNLTSVTLLNGATDHILRILGRNCHNLAFLDISHSQSVTNRGVHNLLIPGITRASNKGLKNPCAQTLHRIVVLGTEIKKDGLELACSFLEYGYSISFLPDSMIYRPNTEELRVRNMQLETGTNSMLWQLDLSEEATRGIEQTVRRFIDRRGGTANNPTPVEVLDFYGNGETNGQIFVRPMNSQIVAAYLQVKKNLITELILPWESFTWSLHNLPDLLDLGTELPNLKKLRARVQGTWEKNTPLFPQLEDAFVWTVCDATALSFLRRSPAIKSFKFNCLNFRAFANVPANLTLNDDSLREALQENSSLRNNLIEISLRPAMKLTQLSVIYLTQNCPKLVRLGDMESWNISSEQIKILNRTLDRNNCKCILTVLSFPPKKNPEYLF